MTKVSLHTISVIMAFIVLFSTLSFTVDKHFCGTSLVGHSVFSSAKKCKSEMISCGVKGSFHMAMGKDSCCSNKKENIQGQDELKTSSFSFVLVKPNYLIPLSFILPGLIGELPLKVIPSSYYKPPLLVADIQVIDQVFLI
ncbi:HYC_CC_PP family protein [Salegentibacter chungangensis]|uniref:Uncharacterized protein n=1 Tax=Salegentibacter chungangensis TaxID=1335724 RepID=A0ABW3NPY7_9FLAO